LLGAGAKVVVVILHHQVAGSGAAVLFLHAGVCDGSMWAEQVKTLSGEYRVIAPDLRGFGQTPIPDEPYSDTNDVIELLDHLEVGEFALVGASYGGRIALEVASSVPERLSRLVLLCSAAPGVKTTPSVEAYGAQEEALLEAGDVGGAVELNVTTWCGPEADESARDAVRRMQRQAFELQLAVGDLEGSHEAVQLDHISAPTQVVTGHHDFDFFQNIGRYLAQGLREAELEELSWAGHLPTLERPSEMTSRIRQWLSGVSHSAAPNY
jgi:pimeloyl-ACP methyl ester carboxylesterase